MSWTPQRCGTRIQHDRTIASGRSSTSRLNSLQRPGRQPATFRSQAMSSSVKPHDQHTRSCACSGSEHLSGYGLTSPEHASIPAGVGAHSSAGAGSSGPLWIGMSSLSSQPNRATTRSIVRKAASFRAVNIHTAPSRGNNYSVTETVKKSGGCP